MHEAVLLQQQQQRDLCLVAATLLPSPAIVGTNLVPADADTPDCSCDVIRA